jgi:UDP-N-acetylglucosamine 2-epimerase (non-hydrolysing)
VQGDTTTVMAAALCAFYRKIKVGHVEAGLRTGDRWNPFPEEMNRIVTDRLSDICFAPTERARQILLSEGIADQAIYVTGNTVIDALLEVAQRDWIPDAASPLIDLLGPKKLILVTVHRRESFGEPLLRICRALLQIAQRSDAHIVCLVHPNPRVRETLVSYLAGSSSITLLPPLTYLELVFLLQHCTLVVTDSGGLQEEAPALGKPVLIMREISERPESIEAGTAAIVGTYTDEIVAKVCELLDRPMVYQRMARKSYPYGDGHAAQKIIDALLEYTERQRRAAPAARATLPDIG